MWLGCDPHICRCSDEKNIEEHDVTVLGADVLTNQNIEEYDETVLGSDVLKYENIDEEELNVVTITVSDTVMNVQKLANPPRNIEDLVQLPSMTRRRFLKELRLGKIEQVCLITCDE